MSKEYGYGRDARGAYMPQGNSNSNRNEYGYGRSGRGGYINGGHHRGHGWGGGGRGGWEDAALGFGISLLGGRPPMMPMMGGYGGGYGYGMGGHWQRPGYNRHIQRPGYGSPYYMPRGYGGHGYDRGAQYAHLGYQAGRVVSDAFDGGYDEYGTGRSPFGDNDPYVGRGRSGYGYYGSSNGARYGAAQRNRRVTHVYSKDGGYEPVEQYRARQDREAAGEALDETLTNDDVIRELKISTSNPPQLADTQGARKLLDDALSELSREKEGVAREDLALGRVEAALRIMGDFANEIPKMSPKQVAELSGQFSRVNEKLRADIASVPKDRREDLAIAQQKFAEKLNLAILDAGSAGKIADMDSTPGEASYVAGRLANIKVLRDVRLEDNTAQTQFDQAGNLESQLARTGMVSTDLRAHRDGNRSGLFYDMTEWAGKKGPVPQALDENGKIRGMGAVLNANKGKLRTGQGILARMDKDGTVHPDDIATAFGRKPVEQDDDIRDRLPAGHYRDRYDEYRREEAAGRDRAPRRDAYEEREYRRGGDMPSRQTLMGTLRNFGKDENQGINIKRMEERLAKLGLLDRSQADGRLDMDTAAALHSFAKETGLDSLRGVDAALKAEMQAMRENGVSEGGSGYDGAPGGARYPKPRARS